MRSRVLLFGHRGARGLFPENTLEGFAKTVDLGVDGIELDVAVTADGVPVVCHDPALDPEMARGADGAWVSPPTRLIRELSWVELQNFDVGRARRGGAVARANPAQVPHDGARIPRLEDALATIPVHILIELKTLADEPERTVAPEAMAEAALAAIDRADAAGRVTIESFDWRGPRHVRRVRPELPLAWLTRAHTVANARLWWGGPHPDDFSGSVPRAVAAEGGGTWAPEHVDLNEAVIAEAHGLGLRVLPWTVNAAARMAELIGWGVDGFITDRPDVGRKVMSEAGLSVPPVTRPRPPRPGS